MTSSPDPRHRLTSDELIAMFVAFLSIGGIFFWALGQQDSGFDLGSLIGSPKPTASSPPLPSGTAAPNAIVGTAPASPLPQATLAVPQIEATDAPQPNVQTMVPSIQTPIATVPAPNPALPNLVPSPNTPASPGVAKPVTGFSDVPSDFWAGAYIGELSRRGIISGFDGGVFKPNESLTRAQFASLLGKAFGKPKQRQSVEFQDVPANYWAKSAIDDAIQTGFMSGYSEGDFRPDQQIPLYQLQVALAAGLKLQPQTPVAQTLTNFKDAAQLPKWSQEKVAAAIDSGLITGYPSPQELTPTRTATRADAAALIYQALVKEGRITPTK
ncbi:MULTISPECIES: S-layer homology domain-containing protein [Leptolyngbya]|uniref:S-layer homology domain-containing protein n=1 Tax=Leptolyngbya boryana CZ1 TaxID=3060204 RepID=A0AA97ATI9_LEPBY|nr:MULTISPECIES: S-layer homology domain-containing protein [Leptolyngbya]MBN8563016.1 S-layer homology domain-containing protein [Leptolyngbya sp. UWPOB_LEPTO1]MCY6488782.1 S-layer homology domain-containing protein [Leptolyngbya sp. GGD]WNZ48594.1 S-layer homology domain-containing protein [Leptolyngbya boryana CZ1]